MFAIIKTGGKQYKVAANDIIKVEKLTGKSGDSIEFTDILMMGQGNSLKVGAPLVANARVFGTVLDQIRDDKVIVFKKKRRHNYRRKNGHRQSLTVIRITDIVADGKPRKVAEAPVKETTKEAPAKKAASKPKAAAPKAVKDKPLKASASKDTSKPLKSNGKKPLPKK